MRPMTKKLFAISLAGSLALAACGDDDTDVAQSGDTAEVEDTTSTTEATESGTEAEVASTESGPAELRAGPPSLLQEHVSLRSAERRVGKEGVSPFNYCGSPVP